MRITIIIMSCVLALSTLWLIHRTEIDFGRVLDAEGNGKVYNGEPFYNYCYYDVDRFHENDIVMTICFLNPLNNYCDDILVRADFRVLENIKERPAD